MIGKGAQYLTAAGFGRYRITAASLGNLDLLGTLGWLTVAAQRAIRGAFGQRDGWAVINATNAYLNQLAAQGQAGKDKATALAGFINEDPMMVCSLGLQPQGVTMPIRWIIGDGTAYIMTNIIVSTASKFAVRFKNPQNLSNYPKVFGAYTSWNAADAWHLGMPSNGNKKVALWINGGDWPNCCVDIYTALEQDLEVTNCTITGFDVENHTLGTTARANSGKTSITGSKPIRIFGANGTWPYGEQNWKWHIAYLKHEAGASKAWFVPCKHNGQCGMYDIEGMTWYGNANSSGSFTIEYTLPDGTPWTPSTP